MKSIKTSSITLMELASKNMRLSNISQNKNKKQKSLDNVIEMSHSLLLSIYK